MMLGLITKFLKKEQIILTFESSSLIDDYSIPPQFCYTVPSIRIAAPLTEPE